jgi:hypothetical protein
MLETSWSTDRLFRQVRFTPRCCSILAPHRLRYNDGLDLAAVGSSACCSFSIDSSNNNNNNKNLREDARCLAAATARTTTKALLSAGSACCCCRCRQFIAMMIVTSPVVHPSPSMVLPWMAASLTKKLYVPPKEVTATTSSSSLSNSSGCVAFILGAGERTGLGQLLPPPRAKCPREFYAITMCIS